MSQYFTEIMQNKHKIHRTTKNYMSVYYCMFVTAQLFVKFQVNNKNCLVFRWPYSRVFSRSRRENTGSGQPLRGGMVGKNPRRRAEHGEHGQARQIEIHHRPREERHQLNDGHNGEPTEAVPERHCRREGHDEVPGSQRKAKA